MAERQAGKARKRTAKTATIARTVPAQQPSPVETASRPLPTSRAANPPMAEKLATTAPAPFETAVSAAALRAVEAERDALRAELEVARARIAELERAREQVLNRIDWVIDSLHNLIEE